MVHIASPKGAEKASDRPSPEVDDAEILDTGQEEVFSRTEVELGRTEHKAKSGDPNPAKASPGRS